MEKYHDVPMDLADASLIAVAEARDLKEVFSFDSDFRIFRLANGSVLEVVPA
jgi:predicted nucleic acid-binding protein